MTETELLEQVRRDAEQLCASVKAAEDGGVSPALVLPELFSVFKAAGMLPEGLDLSMLSGLF